MYRLSFITGLMILTAACAPQRVPVVFDLRRAPEPEATSNETAAAADLEYAPVSTASAAILGCAATPSSPVCNVATPTAEEDSAFRAEGVRLTFHADSRCRKLGAAIIANESGVMMYRKALVRWSRGQTMYGVGHAYELDDNWMVRIARSIDDLNERTLAEKTRTLRHEMSHTIGATESSASGWSAEDYASRCA
jgi:hypothetical protein